MAANDRVNCEFLAVIEDEGKNVMANYGKWARAERNHYTPVRRDVTVDLRPYYHHVGPKAIARKERADADLLKRQEANRVLREEHAFEEHIEKNARAWLAFRK